MFIAGLQRLTLVDFPEKVAATVFLAGCNFRCSFCHNPELVIINNDEDGKNVLNKISEKVFFDFLKKRRGKLDGVCITGGEPTIWKGLIKFVAKIKKLNFLVKLDSNGSNPQVLEELFKKKLLDFVAMDIKNSLENYEKTVGLKIDLEKIKKSVDLIKSSSVDYEFRTTVVPTIHQKEDFDLIGRWLWGSKKYVLQNYQDQGKILNQRLRLKIRNSKEVLDSEQVAKSLKKYFKKVEVRN